MPQGLRRSIVVLSLMAVAACESPTTPPIPTPDAPTLSCPAPISAVSPDGAAVPITYTVPTAVNGQPPVTVSCSRASGSAFSPGTTAVTCTATDALSRSASCNFNVTVTVTPRISKTRFLAFGDSITAGRCGPAPAFCDAYAVRLEQLLRARYTQQTFSVLNIGVPGERTWEGEDRLPTALSTYTPEVLLLMEGTNDLNAGASFVAEALDSLEDMIDIARGRGVLVFIATIAPIAPGGSSNSTIPLVAPFNNDIRAMAAAKGVPLVDVYAALNADIPRYYAGNDLHPLAEGHRVMGDTFYAKIREVLDITPGSPLSPSSMRTRTLPALITRPSGR